MTGEATPSSPLALRPVLCMGASTPGELRGELDSAIRRVRAGEMPGSVQPSRTALAATERLVVDFGGHEDLLPRCELAKAAFSSARPDAFARLRRHGIHRGAGAAPVVCFILPGQGSQHPGMLAALRHRCSVVEATLRESDAALAGILGGTLSDLAFSVPSDRREAERRLEDPAVALPATLVAGVALGRLLAEYGLVPDLLMGHSLGEYSALVLAGALSLGDALAAVCSRTAELAGIRFDDPGAMAAVFADASQVQPLLARAGGGVVVANDNGPRQSVIGGGTQAVRAACRLLDGAGIRTEPIRVSHAFHCEQMAPARGPLRKVLERLDVRPPRVPVMANVDAAFYPESRAAVIDRLVAQVAAPVLFRQGLHRLHEAGARLFVEVGPGTALSGLVRDVLGSEVVALPTNRPRRGDLESFNHALCGLWAAGLGGR